MKVALAADHAGYRLKEFLRGWLEEQGHEVADLGTRSTESTDYPDYANAVAALVSSGKADRGVLVCYTGVGMSIAANKVQGVRAALAANTDTVQLTRAHNDANVLTIGSKYTGEAAAVEYVRTFLSTPFEGGRHSRRVEKIAAIEEHR